MDYKVAFNRRKIKRSQLIADIKTVAAKLDTKVLTMDEYERHGKYSARVIYNRFGSWISALQVARLKSPILMVPTHEQLLRNIKEVWRHLKRQPGHKAMQKPPSKYSGYWYLVAFGSWGKALRMFDLYMRDREKYKKAIKVLGRKFYGRKISAPLRLEILDRDNFRCRNCRRSPANEPAVKLTIDHVKPFSRGGRTIPSNLQTLCLECNVKKADKIVKA